MTEKQIERKIEQLDFWLSANPSHPDYSMMIGDKNKLIKELLKKQQYA